MCRIFDYCAAEMLGRIISRLASVKLRYFCRHKQQLKDWYARVRWLQLGLVRTAFSVVQSHVCCYKKCAIVQLNK
ncbi:hypothetical protein QL093DRAFT_2432132 [Fusarium oxysporum]|nr:hypothetical protein QL093DRAFT_2432132 [Fusarium oxysporum]